MKISKSLHLLVLIGCIQIGHAQNLIDTAYWSVGSGNVTDFFQNGTSAENIREYGLNHVGQNFILWKAVPDGNGNADGGYNSTIFEIDKTKNYRISVWIKKTNSHDGTTYFGTYSPANPFGGPSMLNRLNGTNDADPFFWQGDLPKLNRWYLLVGFVYEVNTTVTTTQGAIYDGVTGEFVQNLDRDFKFASGAYYLTNRTYLNNDTNTSDRQYAYEPRIEPLNGFEPTINQLLSLHPNSALRFAYDNSGSQKQRFYCPDNASCNVPTPPSGKSGKDKNETEEVQVDVTDSSEDYDGQFIMYPNPTQDLVLIKIKTELHKKIASIKVYNINSSLVKILKLNRNNQDLKVDLTGMPTGIYFLHVHLNDGSHSITKRIIKE